MYVYIKNRTMSHTVSIPIHKIIDLIKDNLNSVKDILKLESDKPYVFADEDGIIEIMDYSFDDLFCDYIVTYTQFMYGKIYTKQFELYIFRLQRTKCERYRDLFFERSILTRSLRGRKRLTNEEKKEKTKYIEYLKTGKGVNIEELESIYY